MPCSSSPQATSPSGAASASTQAAMGRRRSIERGILGAFPARRAGGVHAGGDAETWRLVGLEPGDRGPLELAARGVLEDHAQALERLGGLAAHPAGGAKLPDSVDQRGRLAERRQLDTRDAVPLG